MIVKMLDTKALKLKLLIESFTGSFFRVIKGMPSGEQQPGERMEDIPRATPQVVHPTTDGPVARRVIINREYIEKFGYTEGCTKCKAIRTDNPFYHGAHNQVCRMRIDTDMARDPELRKLLEGTQFRQRILLHIELGIRRAPEDPRMIAAGGQLLH